MATRTAASIRARLRAEMTDEIKAVARRHLAEDGANLSLRAVARDLGMVSSALYRYFASRDDLLTALIIDAYNALGEAVEKAEGAVDRGDLAGRWMATCHAVRTWALVNPAEYALIYGSPVPGYRAPEDTIEPAGRPTVVLGSILADGVASGALRDGHAERLPKAVRAELKNVREAAFPAVPEPLLLRGMTAWAALFGAVSFELFGRYQNVLEDVAPFFDHQMRQMATYVGLT
ncbi:MAG TPA: TetR/AcrR family transcriptional regulator [Micromonosporaceae bacterium]|nr:TetR/AcrR family transcriptional regulator [Micromonosporaceae bacterium]